MKVVNAFDAPEPQNVHGVSARPLHDNEHIQVTMVTLQPGEKLRRHITPVDVCFYVLEGRGVVEIGNEEQEVVADQLVDSPAGIVHRLRNDGDAVFRFLVMKTPRPTGPTKVL